MLLIVFSPDGSNYRVVRTAGIGFKERQKDWLKKNPAITDRIDFTIYN